jgi:hypothetical protein
MEEDLIKELIDKVQRQTDLTEDVIREKLIEFNYDYISVIKSYFGIHIKRKDDKILNNTEINKEMYKQFREKLYITPEKERN